MHDRRLRLFGLLGAVAVAGAACASGAAAEPVQPATRQALVELYNTPVEFVVAELKVTAECMAAAGFGYLPYTLLRADPRPTRSLAGLPFRMNRGEAEQDGYGTRIGTADTSHQDVDSAVAAYLATLTPDQQLAYSRAEVDDTAVEVTVNLPDGAVVGAASEGCVAQGRIAVYGSVADFLTFEYFPQGLRQFSETAYASTEFEAAQGRYAGCMRDAGFDVATVSGAVELAQERFGSRPTTGAPSPDEVAMAVTDAECQTASGVYEAVDDALVAAASSWINDHEGELLGIAELQHSASARVAAILAS